MKPARFIILVSSILLLMGAGPSESKLTERQRALHALNRLGFGPRPADVDRVLQTGVNKWIEQQLHPERIADSAVEAQLKRYPTLAMSANDIMLKFYKPIVELRREKKKDEENADKNDPAMRELRREARQVTADLISQRIIRATASERQLNEVMVDFWMNHFNVFIGKGIDRFLLTSYERDTIRPHIWGSFEELLMATAKSPAMLFYLDNARSVAAPENRQRRPQASGLRPRGNEGTGGGLLRPGARGLRPASGLNENYAREIMELHTLGVDGGYTQKDVTELARVFTGWTIGRPKEGTGFMFRRPLHDVGAKTVLGVRFPAGGGIEEGEKMIHVLATHPATAHYIAYKLCQRLVADDPPKSLVERVAKRFRDTNGDLRQTVKAVIDSPEFWDPQYYRAKMKSPFEYAISAVRAVNGSLINPLPLARELQKIGQPLYGAQPPTGYSDTAEAWTNSGALMNRLNFALALAANKMPGVSVLLAEAPLAGIELSEQTKKTIAEREGDGPAVVTGLLLGSPEFQQQ